jgi:hypothetical protein
MNKKKGIGDIISQLGKFLLQSPCYPFHRWPGEQPPQSYQKEKGQKEDRRKGIDERQIRKCLSQLQHKSAPQKNQDQTGRGEEEGFQNGAKLKTKGQAPEKPGEEAIIKVQTLFWHHRSLHNTKL